MERKIYDNLAEWLKAVKPKRVKFEFSLTIGKSEYFTRIMLTPSAGIIKAGYRKYKFVFMFLVFAFFVKFDLNKY